MSLSRSTLEQVIRAPHNHSKESHLVIGVSFNQPTLCPNDTWDSIVVTFVDNLPVGAELQTIFIDTDNTVYTANYQSGTVQIWLEGSTSPTVTITTNYSNSRALFVGLSKEIYIDTGDPNYDVAVWQENANSSSYTLTISDHCYSLFVAGNDSLYCSIHYSHRVVLRSLNSSDTQVTTVAGTGCAGYRQHTLYHQHGIFVTNSSNLYVADTSNHRVQLFPAGQLNATTVAGRAAPGTVQLFNPTAVMLDGDGYLFILDSYRYRIVGSDPYGFRCVIGCLGDTGSPFDQLFNPQSMAFDSYGNIFVTNTDNIHVRKFRLSSNACGK